MGGRGTYNRGCIVLFTGTWACNSVGTFFSEEGEGALIRGNLLYLRPEILTIPLTDSVNCESLSGPNIHHASGFPRLYRKH